MLFAFRVISITLSGFRSREFIGSDDRFLITRVVSALG